MGTWHVIFLRSSVESLACTCVLCCDLVKHYFFLARMLRARMHGALPYTMSLFKVQNASDLLDHANTLHHSFTWIFGFDAMVGITRSKVFLFHPPTGSSLSTLTHLSPQPNMPEKITNSWEGSKTNMNGHRNVFFSGPFGSNAMLDKTSNKMSKDTPPATMVPMLQIQNANLNTCCEKRAWI